MSESPRDIVFVRHGICSNAANMADLCNALQRTEGQDTPPDVDSQDYDWRAPVLDSGISLAKYVIATYNSDRHRRIMLVGHSQGGLVCRVAVAALVGRRRGAEGEQAGFGRDRFDDVTFGRRFAQLLDRWTAADRRAAQRVGPAIAGVVMLATPNAGAMTYGQLSLAGRGLQWLTRKVGSTFGVEDIEDLASDRLFRFLQYYTVERVRYLSISGSAVNRYSTVCHDDLNEMPYVRALGVRMDRPNDLLVEDSSVDLCRSPLPSEIADLPSQYQHIRAYLDCTSVSHTGIHASEEVRRILRAYIRQWGAPPQAARPEPLLTNG